MSTVTAGESKVKSPRCHNPEPPYCWQNKTALRIIREHLDGDSHLPYALGVYCALTENASDKGQEEFATLQSHLAILAGGISTRTVRRVLPILRNIGVIDYATPKLRGPMTFQLLSVGTDSPNVGTNSPNDRTGTKRTAFQFYNRNNKEVTREVTEEVTGEDKGVPQAPAAVAGDSPAPASFSLEGDDTGKPASKASIDAVAKAWNAQRKLPQIRTLSEKRRKAIKTRLKDDFFAQHYEEAIARVAESSFCLGQNNRQWRADFDFFLKPDTVAQLIEGKYDNRALGSDRPTNLVTPEPGQRTVEEVNRAAWDRKMKERAERESAQAEHSP